MEFEYSNHVESCPLGRLRLHHDPYNAPSQPIPASPPSSSSTALVPVTSTSLTSIIPVPTLFVGKIFAAIPASKTALSQEALEAARMLGLAPMLAAAMEPAENPERFWKAAVLSDPLTAANIVQACEVEGKKVMLVERGTAEALARGRVKIQPLAEKTKHNSGIAHLGGVLLAPLCRVFQVATSPVNNVVNKLRWNRMVKDDIKKRQQNNNNNNNPSKSSTDGSLLPASTTTTGNTQSPPEATSSSSTVQNRKFKIKPELPDPMKILRQGLSNPHLAIIPIRVALNLLRGDPGSYLLLAGNDKNDSKPLSTSSKLASQKSTEKSSTPPPPQNYTGADALSGVEVHTVPGLSLTVQSNNTVIHFTPAFLSRSQLRQFWKGLSALIGTQLLVQRRMQRRVLNMRIQQATAIIASGGMGGGSTGQFGSGTGMGNNGGDSDDEDDGRGGFDEPPEIRDMIREMGELPPGLTSSGGGGGGRTAVNGIVRAGATLACGIITVIGPLVELVGSAWDSLLLELPLGPTILGVVPQTKPITQKLGWLVAESKGFNAKQVEQRLLLSNSAKRGGNRKGEITPESYRRALAAQSIWLGILAKVLGENGQLAELLNPEKGGSKSSSPGRLSSSHAPLLALTGPVLDNYDESDPTASYAELVCRILPFLEHNGFANEFKGPQASQEIVNLALYSNNISMNLNVADEDEEEQVLSRYQHRVDSVSGDDVPVVSGKGIIVIGDLDLQSKRKTERGFVMDGGRSLTISVEEGVSFFSQK